MKPTIPTLALFVVAAAAPAFGEQYRIEFQGTTTAVSAASGSWGDDVTVGTPVVLALTVDSSVSTPFDTYSQVFEGTNGSLSVGSFQMQMASNFYVYDNDPVIGDAYGMEEALPSTNNRFPYAGYSAWLGSSDLSLLDGFSPPIEAIDLARFDALSFQVWGAKDDTYGTPTMSRLNASITSYSVTAIPEPATAGLWFGGATLIGLVVLRRRTALVLRDPTPSAQIRDYRSSHCPPLPHLGVLCGRTEAARPFFGVD